MESQNRELERRVWQRVRPEGTAGTTETARVTHLCARAAGISRGLSQSASGARQKAYRQLMAGALESLAVLRGMERYAGGAVTDTVVMNPPPESEAALLREFIRLSREIWIFFASQTAQPEFGAVFQALADRERRRLAQALGLLGRL